MSPVSLESAPIRGTRDVAQFRTTCAIVAALCITTAAHAGLPLRSHHRTTELPAHPILVWKIVDAPGAHLWISSDGAVEAYLSNQGFFTRRVSMQGYSIPATTVGGDLDGDAVPELVVYDDVAIEVFSGAELLASNYGTPPVLTIGQGATSLVVSDLDQDGCGELLAVHPGTIGVTVYRTTCAFGEPPEFDTIETPTPPLALAVGDFGGDSQLDLAVGYGPGSIATIHWSGEEWVHTTPVPVSPAPRQILVADFDRDGHSDALSYGSSSSSAAIVFGQADGALGSVTPFTAPSRINDVAAGDLTRDGHAELLVLTTDRFQVCTVRPDRFVEVLNNVNTPASPTSIAIRNVDGGSIPDVVVIEAGAAELDAFIGLGDGSFIDAAHLDGGAGAQSIAVAELDGAAPSEIVVGRVDGVASIISGNPAVARQDLVIGFVPRGVAAGDLNGDGMNDLVMVGDAIASLLNRGDGTFFPAQVSAASTPIIGPFALGHVDGDSRLDVLAACPSPYGMKAFFGDGDGTFSEASTTTPVPGLNGLAVADFDSDGTMDFATGVAEAYIGNGDGTFVRTFEGRPSAGYASGPWTVASTDFDRDGNLDLVFNGAFRYCYHPECIDSETDWARGDGAGGFELMGRIGAYLGVMQLATDLDGDGMSELVARGGARLIQTMQPGGARQGYGVDLTISCLAAGDVTGDGVVDVAAGSATSSTLSILVGGLQHVDVPTVPPPAARSPLALAARPNPIREAVTFDFVLPAASHATLRVLDVGGRVVARLVDRALAPGAHHERWDRRDQDGRGVPAGVYFVELATAQGRESRRLAVLD